MIQQERSRLTKQARRSVVPKEDRVVDTKERNVAHRLCVGSSASELGSKIIEFVISKEPRVNRKWEKRRTRCDSLARRFGGNDGKPAIAHVLETQDV